MAKGNFQKVLAFTLEQEGGWTNDPHDPGGATMYGIIQTEYDAYRKRKGLFIRSVKFITPAERDEIYLVQYWTPLQCEELPAGIDLQVFDYGVNSGVARSAKLLQKMVGTSQDGIIGLKTLAALDAKVNSKAAATTFISSWASSRLSFLMALTNWKYFGRGWKARVVAAKAAALKMV